MERCILKEWDATVIGVTNKNHDESELVWVCTTSFAPLSPKSNPHSLEIFALVPTRQLENSLTDELFDSSVTGVEVHPPASGLYAAAVNGADWYFLARTTGIPPLTVHLFRTHRAVHWSRMTAFPSRFIHGFTPRLTTKRRSSWVPRILRIIIKPFQERTKSVSDD